MAEGPLSLRARWGHTKSYKLQNFARDSTVAATTAEIVAKCELDPEETYHLYSPSLPDRWLPPQMLLAQTGLRARDTIELKFAPAAIHLCQAGPTGAVDGFDFTTTHPLYVATLSVDLHDPLSEYMDWIHSAMRSTKEEFCFQFLSRGDTRQRRWVNSNISLFEQDITAESFIVLTPISALVKNGLEGTPEKEGNLNKTSIKATKRTNMKKRWCNIRQSFFFYAVSQSAAPSGAIPLEYYEVQKSGNGSRCEFSLLPMGTSFVSMQGGVLPTYLFECSEEKDLADWMSIITRHCVIGAGKQVFGVRLQKVMARKLNRHAIPQIITQAVSFLDRYGLEQQGIFRISGLASQISKFKSDFDCGLSVTFDQATDPHSVSGLLKLYLRELPEPIIPFALYADFVRWEVSQVAQHVADIEALMQQLPAENYQVLLYLVEFLGRVAARHEVNLMSVQNLALVFGPNILRPAGSDMQVSMRLVQDTPVVNRIMELFITERSRIFTRAPAAQVAPQELQGRARPRSQAVDSLDFSGGSFKRAAATRRQTGSGGFLSARGAPSPSHEDTPKYDRGFLSDEDDGDLPLCPPAAASPEPEPEPEPESVELEAKVGPGRGASPRGRPPSGGRGRGPPPPARCRGTRGPAPPGRGTRRLVGTGAKRLSVGSVHSSGVTKAKSQPAGIPALANSQVNRSATATLPEPAADVPAAEETPTCPPGLTVEVLFGLLQEEIAARKALEKRVAQLESELASQ